MQFTFFVTYQPSGPIYPPLVSFVLGCIKGTITMYVKSFIFVVGILICAMSSGKSLACTCEENDKKILFEKAEWVFLAEVTSTRLNKGAIASHPETTMEGAQTYTLGQEAGDIVEATFTVIEVFKKGSSPIEVVRDLSYGFGNCSIPLMSGMEYIFFVHKGQGALENYVGMCTGSGAVNVEANEFPEELQMLRNYNKDPIQK